MAIARETDAPHPALSEERPMRNHCVHDELLADGSMIVFHACRQTMATLNPTAALVWECCDGEHRIGDIIAAVRELFPDAGTVEADVLALLQSFLDEGLIVDEGL